MFRSYFSIILGFLGIGNRLGQSRAGSRRRWVHRGLGVPLVHPTEDGILPRRLADDLGFWQRVTI